jgi:tripartite-type tricarboxylate transporter receptor subunit TctC
MHIRAILLVAPSLAGFNMPAAAQDYPSRPVKVVVPFPAGGPSDTLVRIMGEQMRGRLGRIGVRFQVSGNATREIRS